MPPVSLLLRAHRIVLAWLLPSSEEIRTSAIHSAAAVERVARLERGLWRAGPASSCLLMTGKSLTGLSVGDGSWHRKHGFGGAVIEGDAEYSDSDFLAIVRSCSAPRFDAHCSAGPHGMVACDAYKGVYNKYDGMKRKPSAHH